MHPAYSIIFFTTASGLGYGLVALMGLLGALEILPAERWLGATGILIGGGALTAGLLSSTFHLGHPERAWRAITQWRSSWLSREGVVAILTYAPLAALAWGWVWLEDLSGIWLWAGVATALLSAITVYCTGMIYGSLKAIPRWHNNWVPVNYLTLAFATGAVWLDFIARMFDAGSAITATLAVAALIVATGAKLAYWSHIDNADPVATAESATGLGKYGNVRPLDPPHTEANYLQKEMGYKVARKHAAKLRRISAAALFALPLLMILFSFVAGPELAAVLSGLAALSAAFGVVVERWLFFAEAVHVVMLYYGEKAA